MSDDTATDNAAPARQARRAPGVDLDSMTVPELTAHAAAVEAKIVEKRAEATSAMLTKWTAEAADAGLTIDAVMQAAAGSAAQGRKARKDAGGNLPVKYRGPGGEEWSGRGRLPTWLQAMEAKGRKREEFKV